jgi:acylphosphatase
VTPDLEALLHALAASGLRFVVIGGVAVGVHGYVRATKDLDVCPAGDRENLERLARLLRELDAEQLEVGDFTREELPFDPRDADDLAAGGNFRLRTRLGALDVMQWVPGFDAEQAFALLDANAIQLDLDGSAIRVCSLEDLRRMKLTAGRPQDLVDLEQLPETGG